jgi:hypothetical protein
MTIQIDTREHKKEVERIMSQFDSMGVDYFRSKLWVGDYMNIDKPRIIVDRKKDLLELCGNVTQQHERFTKELIRAQEKGIKLIILCEHGEDIQKLSDVYFWRNPRLDVLEWAVKDGKPCKVQKYPRATTGEALYKSLCTIRDKYGVDFHFCNKSDTGFEIKRLLGE